MRPARSDEPGRQSCSGQTSKTSQEAARGSVGKGLASAHLALVLFVALSLLPAASFGQDAQTAGTAQQGSAVEETGDNPAEPADAPAADTDIALADATTASADTINLSDPNPGSGTNWSYDSASGTFTISAGAVTVTGNTSTRRVVVAGFAAITLSGATINLIGTDSAVPIDIVGSANVRLTLRGDSTLRGGTEAAAMRVADTASLTVTAASTGSLTAIGGEGIDGDPGGAGIQGGSITIQGGTLDARGNESDAAGISASSITISDGRVEAQGGWNTAGITAETIQISGGKVRATGGYCAAGIGGNIGESVGNITISGGTVEANG
ncbi:MAG: hypothetical protein LBP28_07070, partial [Coriobacteriales bacterium]|nr:hypothetical protein [Coriobacteriales bacterium]